MFKRSVVIIIEYSKEGTVGFVLNKLGYRSVTFVIHCLQKDRLSLVQLHRRVVLHNCGTLLRDCICIYRNFC